MAAPDRVRRSIVHQFHNPAGPGGHVVGWIMGHRGSNVARSRWAVGLLAVEPDARVLELGCGPGVALAALAERVADGLVVGVDHSPVMIRQARRRNAAALAAGRVQLVCSPVEDVLTAAPPARGHAEVRAAPFESSFDVALAINSVGFWPEPDVRLAGVRRLLRRDGQIALAAQPRCPGATEATSHAAARELAGLLGRAGFIDIETTMLELDPPVACVRAINPDDACGGSGPWRSRLAL